MLGNIMSLCRNRLSNNVLSLSGELVLTSKDAKNMLLLNDFDRSGLKNKIVEIRRNYPDIKVEMSNGLTEIDIKFFAHQKRIKSDNFLEEFNELLKELVEVALENENVVARLNVFGKYAVNDSVLTYRYLNKKSEVKYIIVDEEQRNIRDKLLAPKITLVVTVVAIIAFGVYAMFVKNKKEVPKDNVSPQKIEQTKT